MPLVAVVTPVYNGERYLREAIESVLAQTYENWQYAILDNCSDDGTAAIVREYASRDERIRLHQNTEFLPLMANWNAALRLIPDDAAYVKVLHADDTLFPECLDRMVELAEREPSVAVVTSYALWGDEIRHLGVPYPVELVGGPEICRSTLLGRCYVFGSPSSTLVRAADVRVRERFYNEENVHADTEVCFELLMDGDLGFVHQVLTKTRIHPDAMTPLTDRINTYQDAWLSMHLRYGPVYLDRHEYYPLLVKRLWHYVLFLAKAAVKVKYRDAGFRAHHRAAIARVLRALAEASPSRELRSPTAS